METAGSVTSKSKAIDDCPILMLPPDILAKIIAYVPIAQWPDLELLYDFRPATLIAWRQLRNVDLDRDFLITPKFDDASARPSIRKGVESILQKLSEHSPFLTSLSGIEIQSNDVEFHSISNQSLARFEHLQSISFGIADASQIGRDIPLEYALEFLESTRSRASLKELGFLRVRGRTFVSEALLDRFATSFRTGREIQLPLKLEKFSFTSDSTLPRRIGMKRESEVAICLDTIDATRLTDVRLCEAPVEPDQLINLIERASSLRRIELSFLSCHYYYCKGPRLEANKQLFIALAAHENLTAVKIGVVDFILRRGKCECMDFVDEFYEMLKAIGRRGQLIELAFDKAFLHPCNCPRNREDFCTSSIDVEDTCDTICDYIPNLQSIKLPADRVYEPSIFKIVSLTHLEEIHFMYDGDTTPVTDNVIRQIARLPHLKRLAFGWFYKADPNSLGYLADITGLVELRIRHPPSISAGVFEKWSDGFASNLKILVLDRRNEKTCHDGEGLARLLEKTVRLRVLIMERGITERVLSTIALSCPELEICGVEWHSGNSQSAVQYLQEIVDHCPKLMRLGGFGVEIRKKLQFPKYRKIDDVDMGYWKHSLDGS